MMNEKIRNHVENLFKDAPNTKRAHDLKEELICNLQDKYQDLVKDGKTETESYNSVISGIGDIDELIKDLEKTNPMNSQAVEVQRKKTAFVVSLCVGLYILTLVALIVLEEMNLPDLVTGSTFFILAGIPTCILIYHFMSRPKYIKSDTTLVEEFKEWKADKDELTDIKAMIQSILWSLIVGAYFIISFMFSAWAFSWVIFIIGVALTNIVELCFKLKK